MSSTLLRTKLFIPPLRPNLVPRLRLIEQLNQGLHLGHKLSLISAPAGFGKTTLVSEWVAGCEREVTWLSLDEGDNNPTRFLTYLVAALQTVVVTMGEEALGMLQAPQLPPIESILTALLNEITAVPDSFILVLDDYHHIDDPAIDKALAFLLEHLPPQMHLVIATRIDPELTLARLRARGQLTELRAADLRFTSSEAAAFLQQTMNLDISVKEITALEARTEGWIAGLQLAALSMRGHLDTGSFIKSFTGSHHFVLDYLVEEVLHQQPASIQTFLLRTSILDRLCGPLCDTVLGEPSDSGRETLAYLEQANLFIVPLDDERRWYRYHHLFAGLLRQRLQQSSATSNGEVAGYHIRASEWYAENGLEAEALHHAFAAGDFERAADLAELAWPAWRGIVQLITWLGWVQAIPDEIIRARPVLSVAYAQALLNSGKLEAAEARLLDAERWLEPQTGMSQQPETQKAKMVVVDEEQFRSLPISLATSRTYHAQATGNGSATVKYASKVLDLLPEEDQLLRGQINMLLGLSQWASGDLEAAQRTFSDGRDGMQRAGDMVGVIQGTFVLVEIKMTLGHLREAVRLCAQALQLALQHGEPLPVGTEEVHIVLSKLHHEQGDLAAAAQELLIGKKLGEQVAVPDWQYRWCIAQAQLEQTMGELERALDLLDEAERSYVRTPLPNVRPIGAFKTRARVKQGKLVEAQGWAQELGLSFDDDLNYLQEFEHITLARVLIAQYKSDRKERSIQEAVELLERLLQAAQQGKRLGSVIEILILQSVAHHALGNIARALEPLKLALKLAEPEGYVRIFVDEGPPMARLLYEARSRGIAPDYVRQLLTEFAGSNPQQATAAQKQIPETELFEPLSEREVEVLQLIAEGLSNKEIAARLYLSLHTIKVHARNIYAKLGVKNRTQAVAKGRALGILFST